MKKAMIVLVLVLLLGGCDEPVGGKAFFEEIDVMERLLDEQDWKSLEKKEEQLEKTYEKHKWRLQLLGDEGEYEAVNESLFRLKAAIKEQDSVEVRTELASIRAFLQDIYSM